MVNRWQVPHCQRFFRACGERGHVAGNRVDVDSGTGFRLARVREVRQKPVTARYQLLRFRLARVRVGRLRTDLCQKSDKRPRPRAREATGGRRSNVL